MNLLVLDEEFPYPTNSGKRTRSFNLYRRLASRFRMRYVGYGQDHSLPAEALRTAGIEVTAVPIRIPPKHGPAFYLRLLKNLASPLPYIVTSHYSRTYQAAVQKALLDFRPDLIVCEWTPYAIYVENVRAVKKILCTHNIEADIWQRYYENEANLLRRFYIREQWRKIKRFEVAALGWVDGAVAVSELDCARIAQAHVGLRTRVVANGVDLEYFRPRPQPEERRHLVFTGSMDWRPNQDAAHYFVREIFPLLRRRVPDLQCTLVGRDPPPDVRRLADVPGMNITGTVDDVRPYVERAAAYVVPLRIGGGSRLKILEALAMGRPVVSTTVGAEGLDVLNHHHILVADDPRSFAKSVLHILQNPLRSLELASEGRRLVEQRYGWDALSSQFASFICEVTGNGTDISPARMSGHCA